MSCKISAVFIAYGSESGNGESLARWLFQQAFLQPFQPRLCSLNELNLKEVAEDALLIVISSSFGDGEAPENAADFIEQLAEYASLPFRYAIFGLGDITYPKFCGYTQAIEAMFTEKSARPLLQSVEADLNFQMIFEQWLPLLERAIAELPDGCISHSLSVKPYGEDAYFLAEVQQLRYLASSEPPVFHLRLGIQGSGIAYQAGDLLYVKIEQNDRLLELYSDWFNDQNAKIRLKNKELRLITKSILRDINKICENNDLKILLKSTNKKVLEDYLYEHDLFDLLSDFDPNKRVTLTDLERILSPITPRAYSISSCGKTHPDYVDLCIRQVSYQHSQRDYQGTVSYPLTTLNLGEKVSIFAKSNVNFHLPNNVNAPLIFIGAGTGIAPYMGFLQQLEAQQCKVSSYLFFGERYQSKDFLYQDELSHFLQNGTLTALFSAFSRDQAEKRYVQHLLLEQGEKVWEWIESGAYFYICGSKAMSKAVEEVLIQIAADIGNQPYEDVFNNIVAQLVADKRLLKDVY